VTEPAAGVPHWATLWLMASMSNGFLREADDSLTVTTSTAGATFQSGFLRSPTGALVVTTDTTNAIDWGGFKRKITGELIVVTAGTPVMVRGFLRDSTTGALLVATGSPVAGRKRAYTLDASGFVVVTGLGFNPASLPNLLAWYKADSLALADAAPVPSWADSSGAGRTMVAQTASPIFKTNIQGGKPIVRFASASSQWMLATIPNTTQPITVVAVLKVTGGNRFFGAGAGGSVRFGAGGTPQIFAGGSITGALSMSTTFHYVTYVLNGASSLIRVDGVQDVTGDAGANSPGTSMALASEGDAAQFWDGDMGELLVYADAKVLADQQALEGYLKTGWGL
jgi:hypothetical protein